MFGLAMREKLNEKRAAHLRIALAAIRQAVRESPHEGEWTRASHAYRIYRGAPFPSPYSPFTSRSFGTLIHHLVDKQLVEMRVVSLGRNGRGLIVKLRKEIR